MDIEILYEMFKSGTPFDELIKKGAVELGKLIKKGKTSSEEVVKAHLRRIKEVNPEINVIKVGYTTRMKNWEKLLNKKDRLMMKLPDYIKSTVWDVVFVDGPRGYNDKVPGRMQSIYVASRLRVNHILVHDCDREVEETYFKQYLGQTTTVIEKLFHKEIREKT